ncbi:MAG: helix-hairpin-helix domain-containing protein, partial [Chloroflexota bacterium]
MCYSGDRQTLRAHYSTGRVVDQRIAPGPARSVVALSTVHHQAKRSALPRPCWHATCAGQWIGSAFPPREGGQGGAEIRNRDTAELLHTIADLLDIKGESPYRVAAYRDAARVIDSLPEDIEEVYRQGRLQDLPRIGPSLAQKIGEYLETGKSTYLAKLLPSVPRSVTELLEVPGIGPRKAQLIHRELGVKTVKELEEAARDHRLQTVPGMGPVTEEKILREVERLQ